MSHKERTPILDTHLLRRIPGGYTCVVCGASDSALATACRPTAKFMGGTSHAYRRAGGALTCVYCGVDESGMAVPCLPK